MKATLQGILNGPNRKPVYTVTRKEDDLRWHWRHTLPQTVVVLLIPTVGIYSLVHGTLPGIWLIARTMYWGALNMVLLAGFVSRSWHGVAPVRRAARRRLATTTHSDPAPLCSPLSDHREANELSRRLSRQPRPDEQSHRITPLDSTEIVRPAGSSEVSLAHIETSHSRLR